MFIKSFNISTIVWYVINQNANYIYITTIFHCSVTIIKYTFAPFRSIVKKVKKKKKMSENRIFANAHFVIGFFSQKNWQLAVIISVTQRYVLSRGKARYMNSGTGVWFTICPRLSSTGAINESIGEQIEPIAERLISSRAYIPIYNERIRFTVESERRRDARRHHRHARVN